MQVDDPSTNQPERKVPRSGWFRNLAVLVGAAVVIAVLKISFSAPPSQAPRKDTEAAAARIRDATSLLIPNPEAAGSASDKSTLKQIAESPAASMLRDALTPRNRSGSFAGGGRITEISVPTESQAVASFQWVKAPGNDVFLDFYRDPAAAAAALTSTRAAKVRLHWLTTPDDSLALKTATAHEGSAYYGLTLLRQDYENKYYNYGCLAEITGVPALVSVKLSGPEMEAAGRLGESSLSTDCLEDIRAARAALAEIGVGKIGTAISGAKP